MNWRRLQDRLFGSIVVLAAVMTGAVLVGIVAAVAVRGVGALSWSFLSQPMREAGIAGGILWQIVGTAVLIVTAAVIALPVAASTAIFSHVYLRGRPSWRRLVEGLLHGLNGVPSIVFGVVGFAVFFHRLGWHKSWLAGGLVLAGMIVPTVAVAFLEKLRAVPTATVEAARGLGLNRAQLVTSVLIPQAASGLATGLLLGLARAAGETAPILFTAVVFAGATWPEGVTMSPVLALPYHIFVLAQDSLDPRAQTNLWGAALVLLGMVMAASALALPLRLRLHEEARHV